MSDFHAIQHTHLLDIPDYGRCSITVTIGKVSILAAIEVPGPPPEGTPSKKAFVDWMRSIIEPLFKEGGKPLVVTFGVILPEVNL
jgi:hypothetical protein